MMSRNDVEIHGEESSVQDRLPYKTGAEICGGVVDKKSGKGMVTITGKGYITLNIHTGPDFEGERYQEVVIQPKQTCMLHGGAVILYYKRKNLPPSISVPPQQPRSEQAPISQLFTSNVEISIRLQVDGAGKFSKSFDKSFLRPKLTTQDFFPWFTSQTGRDPPCLKFTFKDAMPNPKSTEVARGNEDHFTYMRRDIKVQCEKAKKFMPELRDFVVLVTVPGWTEPDQQEEEEW
jgi:hypothetical protein